MKLSPIFSGGLPAVRTKKTDAYIEIVGSSDSRLSSMSNRSRMVLAEILVEQYSKVQITVVNTMSDLDDLVAKGPDLVVLGMKYVLDDATNSNGETQKVWLSSYLDQHDIAYTGSSAVAMALEYDKQLAKQKVIDAQLCSSAYFISSKSQPNFAHDLRYPLFVKPADMGGSKGIDEQSVVYTHTELRLKIQSIHTTCNSDALVEEYLPGREFSVAVVRQAGTNELLAMPIEITAPADSKGHAFLSKAVKTADSERVVPVTDVALKNSLCDLATDVFATLGARDFGRIDMRLDSHGYPSFIEANLMPGLSTHGYLARCFYLNQQTEHADMILSLITLGLVRNEAALQDAGLALAPVLAV